MARIHIHALRVITNFDLNLREIDHGRLFFFNDNLLSHIVGARDKKYLEFITSRSLEIAFRERKDLKP